MTTSRRTAAFDSLAIAVLVTILIWPLFRLGYLDNWSSIESTFIGDARIIAQHLPHAGWQPLWYCGTRNDYVYPPALRYGTALISRIGHTLPVHAYHLYIAVYYVIGILSVYWLVRVGSRARGAALLASAATALLSPSFLFLPAIRHDSAYLVPQRLHVLMSYGEGPHISALAVLPAALAAAFAALRGRRPPALVAAAALCALVVANNLYAATSLALSYPLVVWSVWLCERPRGLILRAAAIPALAWGLSAFWLTPSFVRITTLDMRWVSLPGNTSSRVLFAVAIALYGWFTVRTSNRRPEHAWRVFVCGVATAFGVWVLGFYSLNFRITGEPQRLLPELDLALILLSLEGLRRAWRNPSVRLPLSLLTLAAFYPAVRYVGHAWFPFRPAADLQNVYEYRAADWVHSHLPGARVFATGTVRFWFNVWFDNAQLSGGSDQSILDQNVPAAVWPILHDNRADISTLWLQATGTDAIIAPGLKSPEVYHDLSQPEKFRGVLPVLNEDLPDTVIYAVPRVHPGIVRVVDRPAIAAVDAIPGIGSEDLLRQYVSVVENPAQSAAVLNWHGTDEMEIKATVGRGQSILIQETWDPAWRADENGKTMPVRLENAMGFMLLDVPEGGHHLRMRFETPRGNRAGQIVFGLTAIFIIALLIRRRPFFTSNLSNGA